MSCDLPTQQGFTKLECVSNKCNKEQLVGVYTAQGEYVGSENATANPWLGYEFIWYNGRTTTNDSYTGQLPVKHCNFDSYNQTKT